VEGIETPDRCLAGIGLTTKEQKLDTTDSDTCSEAQSVDSQLFELSLEVQL